MPQPLVVGLGNPGEEYRDTRHNLGFRVLDELARRLLAGPGRVECNAVVRETAEVTLAQPLTYMNRSGYSARCLAERRGVEPAAFLIVYDDVHLPLGRLRFRSKGGSGGHKGMASVLHNLRSEEIPRLRLGVGREQGVVTGEGLSDYVLGPFGPTELALADELVERAAAACLCWLREGAEAVMRQFNG
ncbi:MAG: aminoacyl-tRNA hydrolase [Thermoanaerobaculia bacterium]